MLLPLRFDSVTLFPSFRSLVRGLASALCTREGEEEDGAKHWLGQQWIGLSRCEGVRSVHKESRSRSSGGSGGGSSDAGIGFDHFGAAASDSEHSDRSIGGTGGPVVGRQVVESAMWEAAQRVGEMRGRAEQQMGAHVQHWPQYSMAATDTQAGGEGRR